LEDGSASLPFLFLLSMVLMKGDTMDYILILITLVLWVPEIHRVLWNLYVDMYLRSVWGTSYSSDDEE
jgi:hypothetical protein